MIVEDNVLVYYMCMMEKTLSVWYYNILMAGHTREDGELLHLYFGHMIVVIIGAAIPLAEPVRWKTWQRRIMRMNVETHLHNCFSFIFPVHTLLSWIDSLVPINALQNPHWTTPFHRYFFPLAWTQNNNSFYWRLLLDRCTSRRCRSQDSKVGCRVDTISRSNEKDAWRACQGKEIGLLLSTTTGLNNDFFFCRKQYSKRRCVCLNNVNCKC